MSRDVRASEAVRQNVLSAHVVAIGYAGLLGLLTECPHNPLLRRLDAVL